MFNVPTPFRSRPFHRSEALASGITRSVLQGPQFVRIHEAVYRYRDHVMSFDDQVEAARLALPRGAATTGTTRLRQAGLSYGDPGVLHFVVQGDHHLDIPGIFLHRTVLMPPLDDVGVTLTSAFVAYCSAARVIDVIKVGSWLLNRGLLELDELDAMLSEQPWRWGCKEAAWVLPHLDGRCRSLPESELLALVLWAGLPAPDVNQAIEIGMDLALTPDLRWPSYGAIVEYEGNQHQADRGQYVHDIDRYRLFRRMGAPYELITKEWMRQPRAVVVRIHQLLQEAGYDGCGPDFGAQWRTLFRSLRDVVRGQVRRAC